MSEKKKKTREERQRVKIFLQFQISASVKQEMMKKVSQNSC